MTALHLHQDSHLAHRMHDTPAIDAVSQMRRTSSAIQAIARIVGNSIRNREGGVEPMHLTPEIEAGLCDALEIIAAELGNCSDVCECETEEFASLLEDRRRRQLSKARNGQLDTERS